MNVDEYVTVNSSPNLNVTQSEARRLERLLNDGVRPRRRSPRVKVIALGFAVLTATTVPALAGSQRLRQLISGSPSSATHVRALNRKSTAVTHHGDRFHALLAAPSDVPTSMKNLLLSMLAGTPKGSPPSLDPGQLDERFPIRNILTSDIEGRAFKLYAGVTRKGQVCYVSTIGGGGGPGGCVAQFSDDEPLQHGIFRDLPTDPWSVYGIAADEVASVQVEVDGQLLPAQMSANSYIWTGRTVAKTGPTAIIATMTDKSTRRIRIGF